MNHSFYDHRDGGENGFIFRKDVFEKDMYGTKDNGIESDVARWMEEDWKTEGYDFVSWEEGESGIDQSSGDRKSVDPSDKRIITSKEYFKSTLSIPPCPSIGGVKYHAQNYGSYYPVLGATNAQITELYDAGNGTLTKISIKDGNAIKSSDDYGSLSLSGGKEYGNGNATLQLFGASNSSAPGGFSLSTGGENGQIGLVGSSSTLSWEGTSVAGGAFSAAGMPTLRLGFNLGQVKFLLSGKETSSSYAYSSTGYRYSARIFKAGWIVFFGKIGSGSTIISTVRGGVGGPIINAITSPGYQMESGFSIPCPAGSVVETWISGKEMKNISTSTFRFVPCVAEAVGKSLTLA